MNGVILLSGLFLISILAAGFLMLSGPWLAGRMQVSGGGPERNWLLFLLLGAGALLLPMAILAADFITGDINIVVLLLIPPLEGLLVLLGINWRHLLASWRAEKGLFSALLALLVILLGVIGWREPTIPVAMLIPAVAAAGLWAVGRRLTLRWLWWLSGMTIVLLLGQAAGLGLSRELVAVAYGRSATTFLRVISIALALCLAGGLVYRGLWPAETLRARRFDLLLAALLLLGAGAVDWRHGLMVNATARAAEDHLPFAEVLIAIVVGMVLSRRRRVGFAFTLVAPLFLLSAYTLAWRFDPQQITANRADRLAQAVVAYRADQGVYPPDLTALTPTYLPFILGPLTGRDQIWCYDGGEDYYRLGYVIYQRYYRPTIPDPYFTIVRHAGDGPVPERLWACDEELRRIEISGGM